MILYIFFIGLLLAALWCAFQISVADFRRRIIPDAYLFPLFLIGLVVVCLFPWRITPAAAAIGAAFGYAIAAITGLIFERITQKQKTDISPIGMGDIKLLAVGGWWLGTTGLSIALIFACLFGAIWARRQKQRYIPFAPFFICGAILSLLRLCFLL